MAQAPRNSFLWLLIANLKFGKLRRGITSQFTWYEQKCKRRTLISTVTTRWCCLLRNIRMTMPLFIAVRQCLVVLLFARSLPVYKIEHQVRKCCVKGLIPKLSLHWFRTRKDFGLERRNECERPPRFPTRPKVRLHSFCSTGDIMLRLSFFLACAAPAMEMASLENDRYDIEEHGWVRERCWPTVWKWLQENNGKKERTGNKKWT